MFVHRLSPPARRVGRGVAKPAAVVAVALMGLVMALAGWVTADDAGPLVADPEVAADRLSVGSAPPSDLDRFPSIEHAGSRVALVEAREVRVAATGRPIIVADLAVRNDTDRQFRLAGSMLRLVGPDGRATEVSRFDHGTHRDRLVVDPGRTERVLAVFILAASAEVDLPLLELEIGERGRWPSRLPLSGETPPATAARQVEPLPVLAAELGPVDRQGVTVEPVAATVDVEYGNYRARVDQLVLTVTVELDGPPPAVADLVDARRWQILSTSEPGRGDPGQGRALRVVVDGPVPQDGPTTVSAVFIFPATATDLVVVLGPGDDPRLLARFEIQPVG